MAHAPLRARTGVTDQAGFTLVELLVAMTGALFLSMSVVGLAKFTTQIYQGEARLASATLSNVIGFERLRADIARAGFMSSPNIERDPFVCVKPSAAWPDRLEEMVSVDIRETNLPEPYDSNNITAQEILLSGNYSTTEAFPTQLIDPVGNDFHVTLQLNVGPMARLGFFQATNLTAQAALLEAAFPAGRAARLIDQAGREHYGTISEVIVAANAHPIVVIEGDQPDLQFRGTAGTNCGLTETAGTGQTINTVNFIRYRITDLSAVTGYAPVYDDMGPAYNAVRHELVRQEVNAANQDLANTRELVAEYAVDLDFDLTVDLPGAGGLETKTTNADVVAWTSGWSVNTPPQLIRNVHARLSVRSKEADRNGPIALPGLYRFGVGTTGGAPYARVRTARARIALINQLGVTWQ